MVVLLRTERLVDAVAAASLDVDDFAVDEAREQGFVYGSRVGGLAAGRKSVVNSRGVVT